MDQAFFHAAFVAVVGTFTIIRALYHRKAGRERGHVEYKEGRLHVGLRLVAGVPYMLAVLGYMIRPSILGWAELAAPQWGQWLGFALGVASVPLVWWVQWALGANFATVLHVRDEHTLVTHGPYRWVRHPMYSALFMYALATLLLTRNWFIGGVPLLALTLIIATRLCSEEALMIATFGNAYRDYMRRSGRFLPRLHAQESA